MLARTLRAHGPVAFLVFFLGLNDLVNYPANRAEDSARGLKTLIRVARKVSPNINILIVAPPSIRPGGPWSFSSTHVRESKRLARAFAAVAETEGCLFFDAGWAVRVSDGDKIHLTLEGHAALADALEDKITALLRGARTGCPQPA